MISDLEEVRALAIQRAFDVLGVQEASGAVGYLETHPDDAISVLDALERIEQRQLLSGARTSRTSDLPSRARSTARGCGWMRAADKRGRVMG